MGGASLIDLAKTKGRKPILYSLVSVISVAVSQAVLVACHGLVGLSAEASNVIAVAAGTIPSYSLNRRWVWGKASKSHLWKEVVPFWVLSFVGLVFSTVVVGVVETYNDSTLAISAANLGAFGVLWVGKFLLLHYVLFKDHHTPTGDDIVIPA
ncbi:MAG TPA: GtrA family protein [Acidimicrobiales bacterium]|nr:GtrA family protein [Acidimicrobiales bacterium]